jgi:hypothetical protein
MIKLETLLGGLQVIWHSNYDPLWLYGWLIEFETNCKVGLQSIWNSYYDPFWSIWVVI